jgi:hypothetical protein
MSFMNSKAPPVLGQETAQSLAHSSHPNTNEAIGNRDGQSPIRKTQNGPGGFPNRANQPPSVGQERRPDNQGGADHASTGGGMFQGSRLSNLGGAPGP